MSNARGLAWVFGAFLICPCHLPVTLTVAAALLGGTAAGVMLGSHPIAAGIVISATWLAATWHGFRLMSRNTP
jgi:mercuric ion transport protein